jgi:hypothetical protein
MRQAGAAQGDAAKILRALESDTIGANLPARNARVLKFSRERIGQKVDGGESAMLASRALEAAGAQKFPPFGADADYVWGQLKKPAEALPGDVIQFRDAALKTSITNGFGQSWVYAHHTAVIYSVDGPGRFTILQQNVGAAGKSADKKKLVQVSSIDLANLTELAGFETIRHGRCLVRTAPRRRTCRSPTRNTRTG